MKNLNFACFDTPLGSLLAVADEVALHGLEFINSLGVEHALKMWMMQRQTQLISAASAPICSIQQELRAYFDGALQAFQTPVFLQGTPFQCRVWQALQQLRLAETKSYAALACDVGKPAAFRAVANANAANRLVIVIPCHRIILSTGKIGGYGGGAARKQWLVQHEFNIAQQGNRKVPFP